jgi:hypothetical protein
MQDENAMETDEVRMRVWLEAVGGKVVVGEAKLKSAKISKSGNKLKIVIKKSRKRESVSPQRAD